MTTWCGAPTTMVELCLWKCPTKRSGFLISCSTTRKYNGRLQIVSRLTRGKVGENTTLYIAWRHGCRLLFSLLFPSLAHFPGRDEACPCVSGGHANVKSHSAQSWFAEGNIETCATWLPHRKQYWLIRSIVEKRWCFQSILFSKATSKIYNCQEIILQK